MAIKSPSDPQHFQGNSTSDNSSNARVEFPKGGNRVNGLLGGFMRTFKGPKMLKSVLDGSPSSFLLKSTLEECTLASDLLSSVQMMLIHANASSGLAAVTQRLPIQRLIHARANR